MPITRTAIMAAAALSIGACASIPAPGPVEVTRFVDETRAAQLGQGTIFIDSRPMSGMSELAAAPYKAAVARELEALGYRETSRAEAGQIAEVSVDRFDYDRAEGRRGPVSVGVGGSTGTYGSGVGLGVGINLGGGRGREIGTELAVAIKPVGSQTNLWEGRAQFVVSEKSDLARQDANAQTVADALFRNFPGRSGETIEVEVD
ncbi:DUF4136 domain-containing protein [Qipengyuania atrilutea]|uniref:DUF4136 domain-containing protein n=1 Tax=Qipengyuania atrilutea TaxID=2744473 RepID=A0A850H2B6_9SPHN|nr:hypothetical protein [Actirhodobacter atriluteus]NVD44826.1 hypothetical protein [Actirhodobacter atriluteus]